MLLPTEEDRDRIRALYQEAAGGNRRDAALHMTAEFPHFAPGWILLADCVGDQAEAERAMWRALETAPCSFETYLTLAELLTARDPISLEAKYLRTLALWKLSFRHKIPDHIRDHFEPALGPDAAMPEAYRELAEMQEKVFTESPEDPDITDRLRPYNLLCRIQREAAGLSSETLNRILAHGAEVEPVLLAALRDWGYVPGHLDARSWCHVVALMGELSGPDIVPDFFELLQVCDGQDEYNHLQWALWRLCRRHPVEVLDFFRASAGSADLDARETIAELVGDMPPTPGDVTLLQSLLDGFEDLGEDDRGYLLISVLAALASRLAEAEVRLIAGRFEALVLPEHQDLIQAAIHAQRAPLPGIVQVQGKTIADVCTDGVMFSEDDSDEPEDDFDFDEDEMEEEVDLAQTPKIGPNEPCWCGSGKKYKKCHRAEDEETARREAEELDRPVPASFLESLDDHIWKAAEHWLSPSDIRRAQKQYFGDRFPDSDDPAAEEQFEQWLAHDFRDGRRETLYQKFRRLRADELSDAERELLEAQIQARFSIYAVEEVVTASGLKVRDAFAGDELLIHDAAAARKTAKGAFLMGRALHSAGRWILAGPAVPIDAGSMPAVRDVVDQECRAAGQSAPGFVKANSHRLHRIVSDAKGPQTANSKP